MEIQLTSVKQQEVFGLLVKAAIKNCAVVFFFSLIKGLQLNILHLAKS